MVRISEPCVLFAFDFINKRGMRCSIATVGSWRRFESVTDTIGNAMLFTFDRVPINLWDGNVVHFLIWSDIDLSLIAMSLSVIGVFQLRDKQLYRDSTGDSGTMQLLVSIHPFMWAGKRNLCNYYSPNIIRRSIIQQRSSLDTYTSSWDNHTKAQGSWSSGDSRKTHGKCLSEAIHGDWQVSLQMRCHYQDAKYGVIYYGFLVFLLGLFLDRGWVTRLLGKELRADLRSTE